MGCVFAWDLLFLAIYRETGNIVFDLTTETKNVKKRHHQPTRTPAALSHRIQTRDCQRCRVLDILFVIARKVGTKGSTHRQL